jgi:hypothetical protein
MSADWPNTSLSIATPLTGTDMGYAALYSRAGEFEIYATPIAIVLSGFLGWLAYKTGATQDVSLSIIGYSLVVTWWIKWAISVAILLHPAYQFWKFAGAWPGSDTTHHVFAARGIEILAPDNSTLLPWTEISKAVETKKGFLFYRKGTLATFVPARHLEGPAEAALIRKFIRHNVADASLLA